MAILESLYEQKIWTVFRLSFCFFTREKHNKKSFDIKCQRFEHSANYSYHREKQMKWLTVVRVEYCEKCY